MVLVRLTLQLYSILTLQLYSILAEERNTPMGVVLLQEILRYNHLVTQISNSLVDLEKGIKGRFCDMMFTNFRYFWKIFTFSALEVVSSDT